MNAEEILKAIEEMENEERIKFLEEMFYKYYNNSNLPRIDITWDDE